MGESHPHHRLSVHAALGGSSVADVLLWRRWFGGASLLVFSTIVWLAYEKNGYNPLTSVANVLLVLTVILFIWAKSASLFNRPLPPIPNMEISERSITKATNVLLHWINYALSIAHDITVNHNLTLFAQVFCCLYAVFYVGGLTSFLTFCYIGVILLLTVPLLYEKCQDHVERFVQTQCKKIPLSSRKEKKI